jgi:DNA processing protein
MRSPVEHAVASATLTYLAEPADPVLRGLLEEMTPAGVLACIRSGMPRRLVSAHATAARWRSQLDQVPTDGGLAEAARKGIRLVCPGDPEWPPQLDDLGARRPYALWIRGSDLRSCCTQAVSVVGSRAATAYGTHVGTQIAADLAERSWTIISGAAFGIDSAAHHGALLAGGRTIAVLACGADVPYPYGHATLLETIAASGTVVSEYPLGWPPTSTRFLARNRLITALSAGTVVVEAGLRSGAVNAARHARDLGRPVMAVPGPVTSSQSAGCHQLIRDGHAICITCADDVITDVSAATGRHCG